MGDIISLIQKIRTDKEAFKELVDKMEPLIKKYTRLLYKDEKEDVRAEMTMTLWEAVIKLKYCEKDEECLTFLCTALKNRFYELYRKSRKEHDNQVFAENEDIFDSGKVENMTDLDDVIFNIDAELFLKEYGGKKREIFRMIIMGNESDTEIAEVFSVTRQYVNRMRRELYREILDRHFI